MLGSQADPFCLHSSAQVPSDGDTSEYKGAPLCGRSCAREQGEPEAAWRSFSAATGLLMNSNDARLHPDSGPLWQATDTSAVPHLPQKGLAAFKFSHWSSHGSNSAEDLDTNREVPSPLLL